MDETVNSAAYASALKYLAGSQKQQHFKVALQASALFTLVTFLACVSFRIVPALNGVVSGPFEPLRWISDRLAHQTAYQVTDPVTIATLPSNRLTCSSQDSNSLNDDAAMFYVFFYSEADHSVCMQTFIAVPRSFPHAEMLDLREANFYTRSMPAVLTAVHVAHVSLVFPSTYISLLDWGTTPNPALLAKAGNAGVQHTEATHGAITNANVNLDLSDLRGAIAQRHNSVDAMLDFGAAVFAGVTLLLTALLLRQHRQFKASFGGSDGPRVSEFLSTPVPLLAEQHLHRMLNRQRETIDWKRALRRIAGAAQPRPTIAEKEVTPEERLDLLLESLRPLTESQEEFSACTSEAKQILLNSGFRSAREYIVTTHDLFKKRAREASDVGQDQESFIE